MKGQRSTNVAKKATTRKAGKATTRTVEHDTVVCGWDGCPEHFDFRGAMPEGWRWLLIYHSPRPAPDLASIAEQLERDMALCPEHAAEIQKPLYELISAGRYHHLMVKPGLFPTGT